MGKMLAAFQLNLSALSMVSLLVAVFLVFNTVSTSVARRRTEIGIIRALGVTRAGVRLMFLGEALLYAVPGVLLGGVAGVAQLLLVVLALGHVQPGADDVARRAVDVEDHPQLVVDPVQLAVAVAESVLVVQLAVDHQLALRQVVAGQVVRVDETVPVALGPADLVALVAQHGRHLVALRRRRGHHRSHLQDRRGRERPAEVAGRSGTCRGQ